MRFAVFAVVLGGCRPTDCHIAEHSPDGRFSIEVCREEMLFSMPGGASDAPGEVRLLDRDGHVLERAHVDMVQLYGEPAEWEPDRVSIRDVSHGWWTLPAD